mmetsp:Transcript_46173/g.76342  ORF Transcript_46173/g.76342 Transcript_46173/m.76342 type:complete len:96 (-) Transcript_46173:741-1028(-)
MRRTIRAESELDAAWPRHALEEVALKTHNDGVGRAFGGPPLDDARGAPCLHLLLLPYEVIEHPYVHVQPEQRSDFVGIRAPPPSATIRHDSDHVA